ncbi:MAG TPA: DNA-processing protein DprA, partial [Solirubrobacteraceae bacterium]|nr:DNA-processing protein DprA [Solirubrobacteraceae bacterium]
VRLVELLALQDGELLAALGGRRRAELTARYERFDPGELRRGQDVEAVCRHDSRYPRMLSGRAAPRMLNVAGGVGRLRELVAAPVVALVGSRSASDYGMEVARSLARGLTASGVTVTGLLADGIARAAHAGALEARGGTVAVVGGGLDVTCPARTRPLYARVRRSGCAVSELPCDCRGRRWGTPAGERIVAELATLTVVVEAEETPRDLAAARMAMALGRPVAALPGRVTSPLSRGAHALLMDGAHLMRGPQDALELLYGLGARPAAAETRRDAHARLEPRLQATLERVGAGSDTPETLAGDGEDAGEVLLALSELELMGLLARGDGGRYVPRCS